MAHEIEGAMSDDPELAALRERRRRQLIRAAPTPAVEGAGPVRLDDNSFDADLRRPGVLLVDLWAAWCGPCIRMGPMVEALARDYLGKARIAKVTVDESPYTAARYGVTSIPTFLVFRDGKLVDELVGAMPRPALESRLQRWLQAA